MWLLKSFRSRQCHNVKFTESVVYEIHSSTVAPIQSILLFSSWSSKKVGRVHLVNFSSSTIMFYNRNYAWIWHADPTLYISPYTISVGRIYSPIHYKHLKYNLMFVIHNWWRANIHVPFSCKYWQFKASLTGNRRFKYSFTTLQITTFASLARYMHGMNVY